MPLMTSNEYLESLRKQKKRIFISGEAIENYVDHPIIRPSINSCAMTYELSHQPEYEELLTTASSLTGKKINRFLQSVQNEHLSDK